MSAKTELDKLLQDWANSFEQKNAKACAACYTEDAFVLSSYGDKAHGLEAIEATMREWIEGGAQAPHRSACSRIKMLATRPF